MHSIPTTVRPYAKSLVLFLLPGRLPIGGGANRASNDKRSDDQTAAFDVDYGWGGGRFGKRRGDALGMAGRFGRSVPDHIDIDSNRN